MNQIEFHIATFTTLPASFEDELSHLLFQYGSIPRANFDQLLKRLLTSFGYSNWLLKKGIIPKEASLIIAKTEDLPYVYCRISKYEGDEEDGVFPYSSVNISRYENLIDVPLFQPEPLDDMTRAMSHVTIALFHPFNSEFRAIYPLHEINNFTQRAIESYQPMYDALQEKLLFHQDLEEEDLDDLFASVDEEMVETEIMKISHSAPPVGFAPPFAFVNLDIPLYLDDVKQSLSCNLCVVP